MKPLMRSRGFALAAAIFLLVILTLLGAFIINISAGQHIGQALDIEGERAWQAANAGMDWTRYEIAASGACPANTTWGGSQYSLAFPGTQTLTSFAATVECYLVESTNVNGVATSVFEIRVTACNRPQAAEPRCPGDAASIASLGYVERQLQGLVGL
jgi:MSHA biogenesis protein MshP